jgi:hypothetical protein
MIKTELQKNNNLATGTAMTVLNLPQLSRVSWVEIVKLLSCKDYLEEIKHRAIAKWGERYWLPTLAREYVKVAQEQGDLEATYEGRRSQIHRAFKMWSCHPDTLLILAAAVGCKIQMVCTTTEVVDFQS